MEENLKRPALANLCGTIKIIQWERLNSSVKFRQDVIIWKHNYTSRFWKENFRTSVLKAKSPLPSPERRQGGFEFKARE